MSTCPYCASSLPDAASTCPTCGVRLTGHTLELGSVIAEKYRVEEVLGQGGFGITYLAFDTTLEHHVAIKELFPEGSTREGVNVVPPPNLNFAETKQKFLEEARVVQRFNHRNIVRVYGTFEENHTAYIVMEALSGSTLSADVASNGPFPEKVVLEMARQLCDALEVVHAAGLLHRDIKPDNVFLSSDSRVVLIDFGSARGFMQGQVRRVTRLVTPGYAAPEQYASAAAFGAYTDVYGLAATLYHAVEGAMPPAATDLMLGTKLEFQHSGRMRAGLEAGLKVKVSERPATVADFKAELERQVQSAPIQSRFTSVDSTLQSPPTYVLHWRFETDLFRRALRQFPYAEVRLIKVKGMNVQVDGDHSVYYIPLGIGALGVFVGFFVQSAFTAIIGILSVSIGLSGISTPGSVTQITTRYGLWIDTVQGEELLDYFTDEQDAIQLGRAIQQRSSARLEIAP
jgi:serine/threonine protein kinase